MAPSIKPPALSLPLDRLESVQPAMAKADLKNVERWRELMGAAVRRCFSLAGVSQKEAAGLLDRDQAQVARWISGAERPQFDALFAAESLRQPLLLALAELAGVEVETVVRVRRSA
jgi:hypothetical protein